MSAKKFVPSPQIWRNKMSFADDIEASLRQQCATLPIDGKSFQRRMARCSLPDCRGMCCYDGVHVDAPTEAAITVIASARRSAFEAMGLALPDAVVVDGFVGDVLSGRKTATRPWAADEAMPGFPTHFERTFCVFRLDDGRCGLQVMAMQDGVHPWAYKPSACWLFPISIRGDVIRICDETNDPSRYEAYKGFVSYTGCGQTCADGAPAAEVFTDELRYLGDLIGRDLIAEVNDQISAKSPPAPDC